MALPRTPAEMQALTNTAIWPIYDAMQLAHLSLLPIRPATGKGNQFSVLKQTLLHLTLSSSFGLATRHGTSP